MKTIKIRKTVILFDDEDEELVMQHTWHIKRAYGGLLYARTTLPNYGSSIYMHQLIMQPDEGQEVDHITHDGIVIDNRRSNMRLATRSQNHANRRKLAGTSSKYKGVCWNGRGKWQAQITDNYKNKYLGVFLTQEEAAQAYNLAAKELFGEYAKLNVITQLDRSKL